MAIEPVEAEGDAAVRRRAVSEGFQHVAEAGLDQFGRNLQDLLEDEFLHVGLMNADGAAAQFHAVDHDVVMLAADFFGVACQQRDVLGHRRGKGMMAGIPAVLFACRNPSSGKSTTHRKSKRLAGMVSLPWVFEQVGAIEADFAQDFAGVQPLVGGE